MILHAIFLVFFAVMGSSLTPETLLYVAIAQGIAGIALTLWKGDELISPYTINLAGLIITNLGNLSLIARIHNGTNLMYFFASADDIPLATQVWTVACSVFYIGYLAAKKASLPPIGLKFGGDILKYVFYGLIVMSLFSKEISHFLFLPAAVGKILGFSGLIGVLFYARLWAAEDNPQYRNYTMILYVVQTYEGLFNSYLRLFVVLPTLLLYIGYFAGTKSVKSLLSYRAIPLVVAIVLFANSFAQLGSSRANFGMALYNLYLAPSDDEDVPEQALELEVDDYLDPSLKPIDRGGFLDRSSTLAQVSKVIDLVNTNGYYEGVVSAPLLTAVIPRFLWPDKPKIAIGQWFAIAAGAAYQISETTVNNSVNITIPGELYIDFGWVGVIIGCFLFGVLIRMLWNCCEFYASNYNFLGAIFGGYLLYLALTGISIDLQIVINYLSFYLVFYAIKKILCVYFV